MEQLAARCAVLGRIGVDHLLIREKQLSEQELVQVTRRVKQAVAKSSMRVLLAGAAQWARAAGADGVHVGSDYRQVKKARSQFPEGLVSASCHSLEELEAVLVEGVDMCLFGPIFGKTVDRVEVVPGIGLRSLQEACLLAGQELPIFALGGVTAENAAECVEAGATGVAGIRMFFGS